MAFAIKKQGNSESPAKQSAAKQDLELVLTNIP